jgi:hypothetical protein
MTRIAKNTDLNAGGANRLDGWETSAASSFNVVVYTANNFAAYSDDGGDTFTAMDLNGLCQAWGEVENGDQVVIYIPQITQFAWLVLTGKGNVVLALASPREIQDSGGRSWTSWLIPAKQFGDGVSRFDQPTVAVGDNFLYVTCNLGPTAIALRLSIAELYARGTLHLIYINAPNVFWLRPAQNTGRGGYFAALLGGSYRDVRVFSWPERSNTFSWFDVRIDDIPTEDWVVKTPDGDDWLGNQRGSLQVLGLTLTGTELWAAWFANRRVSGQTTNTFNYPHIGIAIIDVQSKKLVAQRYIWNPDYAFVFPSLATNADGDVGLSFCWGGEKFYPQYGVGMLTGRDQSLVSVSSGISSAAGGDYTSIRMAFPDVSGFCASGFNQIKPGPVNHPRYVLFGP